MAAPALLPSLPPAGCDSASYPEKLQKDEFVSVQHLVESLKVTERTIPSRFVRVKDQQLQNIRPSQPPCNAEEYSIPVIDMKALSWEEQAVALGHAFEEWGICMLVNHGIPLKLMENLQKASLDFFNLPLEEKLVYSTKTDPFSTPVIYIGGPQNDWRDLLKLISYPRKYADLTKWPEVSGFRELMEEYTEKTQALASTMYELVSKSLGLERDYLARTLGTIGHASLASYYPTSPIPDKTIGNRAHSDSIIFTFVLQDDVGGLQLLKNGSWIDCKPIEGSLVVNCGDIMQILTNSEYKSVYHRVLSSGTRARLSILSFISPLNHIKISPIPELLDANNLAKYPTLSTKEITQALVTKENFGFRFLDSIELKNK